MKVAIISRGIPTSKDPVYGVFEFDQAKALAQQGIDIAFIVIDFRNFSHKRKFGLMKYQKDGVNVFELSLPIGVYRRALPVLQWLLLIPFGAMLKSFGRPDVIHAHFYLIAAIASILKRKYNIPFIVTEHSSKLNKPTSEISNLDKRLAAKAYQKCDQLICVSEALHKNILKSFHQNSIVIPNMVDDHSFHLHETPAYDSPFVYVSVGNLIPLKGFDKLIEAFAGVHDNTQLLIIGDGPEKKRLQQLILKLGLLDSVKLLGQLERNQINEIFQHCHAFVLNSTSETFGVCYIEAMYAGLPVIATRCGGPESFVNESNGILVSVNNVVELTNAMQIIRQNYRKYNSKQISDNCIAQFSPKVIAEKIVKSYKL